MEPDNATKRLVSPQTQADWQGVARVMDTAIQLLREVLATETDLGLKEELEARCQLLELKKQELETGIGNETGAQQYWHNLMHNLSGKYEVGKHARQLRQAMFGRSGSELADAQYNYAQYLIFHHASLKDNDHFDQSQKIDPEIHNNLIDAALSGHPQAPKALLMWYYDEHPEANKIVTRGEIDSNLGNAFYALSQLNSEQIPLCQERRDQFLLRALLHKNLDALMALEHIVDAHVKTCIQAGKTTWSKLKPDAQLPLDSAKEKQIADLQAQIQRSDANASEQRTQFETERTKLLTELDTRRQQYKQTNHAKEKQIADLQAHIKHSDANASKQRTQFEKERTKLLTELDTRRRQQHTIVCEQFANAIITGNLAEVKGLIVRSADIHQPILAEKNMTPAQLALKHQQFAVLDVLLQQGASLPSLDADIYIEDKEGNSPLHHAASKGYDRIIRTLVDLGASVDARNDEGQTPLHEAASGGHELVIRTLVDLGASIDARNDEGQTPLHNAASWGHELVIRTLVDLGATVDVQNKKGETPLHKAASWKHELVIRTLVDLGANINAQDRLGETPLHTVAKTIDFTLGARALALLSGGSLSCLPDGKTAHTLIDLGATIDIKNNQKETPLSLSVSGEEPNLSVAEALIKGGAAVNTRNFGGQTPLGKVNDLLKRTSGLYLATQLRRIKKLLLDAGVQI